MEGHGFRGSSGYVADLQSLLRFYWREEPNAVAHVPSIQPQRCRPTGSTPALGSSPAAGARCGFLATRLRSACGCL